MDDQLTSPEWENNDELKKLNATMEKVLERLNSIDNHLFQVRGEMKVDRMKSGGPRS